MMPPNEKTYLRLPSESWVLPVEILNLQQAHACQRAINILLLSVAVIPLHPEQQHNAHDEDQRASAQVETVANLVVRCVEWEE